MEFSSISSAQPETGLSNGGAIIGSGGELRRGDALASSLAAIFMFLAEAVSKFSPSVFTKHVKAWFVSEATGRAHLHRTGVARCRFAADKTVLFVEVLGRTKGKTVKEVPH